MANDSGSVAHGGTHAATQPPPAALLSPRALARVPAALWPPAASAAAPYDLRDLAGPPLAGCGLTAYRMLCEAPLTGDLLYTGTLLANHIAAYAALPLPEPPQ